ncbi:uncharacterized protein FIBRA_00432 [Fibroporia radiculosa]|uniref:coproporphyrinogen oxidase n=1 Tax=Fibroporia radiculosa TaxID=599839 RepID=J4GHR7_9APHY|nr:uncharacterized protein FIBRA_00432 [Fibroporia radiculosa]CCL98435.1 predicted protein [Fibroporia radiculosa]
MSPVNTMRKQSEVFLSALQEQIVAAFLERDPTLVPKRDSWTRPQGGGGASCVLVGPGQDTAIEKAGVNTSTIHSVLTPTAAKQMGATHPSIPQSPQSDLPLYTTGISIVVHARNPHAPSVHMHLRYVEVIEPPQTDRTAADGADEKVLAWWFGGSIDLTPTYIYEEDARHFHTTLKGVCDAHGGSALYRPLKNWCDEFFYIRHRQEARGIGGIFFRDLSDSKHARLDTDDAVAALRPKTQEAIFAFVKDLGHAFLPSYLPILERRKGMPADRRAARWQSLRRGRYVEFYLTEAGTQYGLSTPGVRVESVLMGMPEMARWEYTSEMGTEVGTEEERTVQVLRTPRDWVHIP